MDTVKRFAVLALAVGLMFLVAGNTAYAATCTWNGSVDSNWNTAGNWTGCTGGGTPAAADNVLLDNSVVSGNYTVNLPTGAVTIAINNLTITPGSGNTITVILPSGNTANPGFNVGDNTAATDDIILNNGAILQNSSGAGTGNGIQVNGTGNGTARINNGGKYIHNTFRSTGGIVPQLSTASGTETGIFEYDSPGTGSVAIGASGRNYGSLTLTRTAGAATYTASGSNPLTVRGNLTINTGITFNSTMTGALNLAGNWVSDGVYSTSSQTVVFNGSGAQNLTASSAIAFYNLTVNSGVTLVETVSADNVTVSATLTNNGIIRKAQSVSGTGTKTFGLAGTHNGANLAINVTTQGALSNLQVDRIDSNHPNSNGANQQTGRYWNITPTGSGYTANLTLPRSNAGAPSVCRYYSGTSWWCAIDGSDSNSVTRNNISEFSDWAVGNDAPTSIILAAFKAKLTPKNKVRLKWQTANESELVGFNLYRRAGKNKPWVKLNAEQIDAVHIGQPEGGTYQWTDKTAKAGKSYRYQLEILKGGGASLWSEIIKVTIP